MTITGIDDSQRKAARIAGFTYLITFATVVAANYGISGRLIIPHDAAATARNIIAHELLFRINIALFLIYSAGVVVLLSALYVTLKPVNPGVALVAAFSRLVFALMWLVAPLGLYVTLRVLNADYMQVFGADRVQALAKLYAGDGFEGYYVGLPFYGLASTLCFYLLFKSNYIPRALAAVGAISSAWCVATALAFIIIPNFDKTVNLYWLDSPMVLSEIVLGFWLLFKGLPSSGTAELRTA
jgi:Domain of unknown function (DUF4386)